MNRYSGSPTDVSFVAGNSDRDLSGGRRLDRSSEINSIRFHDVRILLADDSSDNQKLFARILTSAGAEVEVAENGEVAVRKMSDAATAGLPFTLVIMDIRMPVMDGYDATKKIRLQGFTGPVIALTAHATPGEEERCRSAGCSDFQLKPIDRFSLLSAVKRAADSQDHI